MSFDGDLQIRSGEIPPPLLLHSSSILRNRSFRNYCCDMADELGSNAGFGIWLARQLARRELSPAEFSRRYGFDTGAVSRYLAGTRLPNSATVDKIADALNVDVDVALSVAGHRPSPITIDPESPEAQLLPILEKIAIDEETINTLRVILEQYAKMHPRA